MWLLTQRSVFTDDVTAKLRVKLDDGTRVLNVRDPSRVAVAEIAIQPGAQFPWHTHLGPVIATVAEGELIYVNATDCVQRPTQQGPPSWTQAGPTSTPPSTPSTV